LFDEAALTAVAHQRDNVLTLARAGARTFLIPNVADLGLTPAYRGSVSQTQLAGASQLFRDHLAQELALLRDELSSKVVDERERRRTLLGKLNHNPEDPGATRGERYATCVGAYHREDGRTGAGRGHAG
jgi:hypothetical protein